MQKTYDPNKDIVFSWNATPNTTHYNAYFDKMNSDGTYTRIENAFYVESGFIRKLNIGKYRIVLQATNSNYYEADHSNWLFAEGNWIEFEVSHSYKSTVTAPTCTAQGYTTHTCSVCSDSYKDAYTAALGHNYTYKVAAAPTTSANGKLTGTCSRCNSTTAITLPKLNTSDYTYSVVKAASCTATGTGRYVWKTTTYGKYQFDVTLPKTDHSYKSTVTAPTCTERGYTTHTCSVCGDSYKDTYTATLGHSYTYKVATTPTASADGKLTGTCSHCNGTTTITLPKLNTSDYTYSVVKAASCTATGAGRYVWKMTTYGKFQFDVTLPKANHRYKSTVTAPTCTERGYTSHTCSVCGDSYKDAYTAALGHNYTYKVAAAPTTSANGKLTGTCSRCNSTTAITLPKLNTSDYTYSVVKAASCTATGTGRYVWKTTTYGKYQFDVTLPKTDHSYKSTVTAPTCTERGYTTHTCSVCGDSYKDTYTAALGHDYVNHEAKAATCTEIGWEAYQTCRRCDYTTYKEIPSKGHAPAAPVRENEIAPTCTVGGSYDEVVYCSVCNAELSRKAKKLDALGHDFIDHEAKAATCTEIGWEAYQTCSRCDYTTYKEIPVMGHTPAAPVRENEVAPTCTVGGSYDEVVYCSVCKKELSRRAKKLDALGHDFIDHEAKAATCAEIGWGAYQTCSRCDYTTYKEISALGHDWGDPVYEWADDHSAITATHVCKRDPAHTETETGIVTSAVTKEATYDAEGEITYTAAFANPAFEPQTAVVSLPRLERPAPTPAENPFADIRESAYYHDPVLWAVANNVTNGTSDSTFSPDEGCTRAQVVTFLWRAAGKPDPASSESPFSDVKEGAYYYNAVLWAVEKGITNGTSDKTFSPDETCTRAQIVTFLWRYEEQPAPAGTSNPFADVKPNAYFGSAVLWAVEKGITNGTSATTFDPEDTCTRAQVVTFLYRDIAKS